MRPFAQVRARSDRARGGDGTSQRREQLRHDAQNRRVGAGAQGRNELHLPLVEGRLRRPTLRRASQMRGVLACANLTAALVTLAAIDRLDPDAALLTPETLALIPAVLLLARTLGLYHKDEVRLRQTTWTTPQRCSSSQPSTRSACG